MVGRFYSCGFERDPDAPEVHTPWVRNKINPLLLFNREGDCLAAKLRPGNVHSADDWEELLFPEIERQQKQGKEVVFRADAAFAEPEVYEALEERGVKYAIPVPANDSLERDIAELLTRPVGRPSHKPVVWYTSFLYQAASWKTARRVVVPQGGMEFHAGELFPRVGFIVTTLETGSRATEVARHGKDRKNSSHGGGRIYNRWRPGGQNGNPG
jgi:hypothetical protein